MEAVILIGIQGSGKSTFCRYTFFDTHLRLNLDMLKTRHREKILLEACLESKQPFVVDNTNPTADDRQRYIAPARENKFRVVGYYFQSDLDDCKKRNQGRPADRIVPDCGLLATYGRLEIPNYAEGFDELHYVAIDQDGRFDIKEWKDEV